MRNSFDSLAGAQGPRRTSDHRTTDPSGETRTRQQRGHNGGRTDNDRQNDRHGTDRRRSDRYRNGRGTNVEPENWRDLANCRGRMELFFAKRAERPEARARREAKALTLCAQCSVAEECRQFARQHHEYGFWAGESEEDRHVLGFTVSAPIGTRARRHEPVRREGTAG